MAGFRLNEYAKAGDRGVLVGETYSINEAYT
jgi:hypothetical protein